MGRFLAILLVLVILIGGAAVYFGSQLGGIVASEIETTGSAATKTDVVVGNVGLTGLLAGRGSISNLVIANPTDYTVAPAVSVGSIDLSVDPWSVIGDGPIHVREVIVDKPAINYEGRGLASNLSDIKRNVDAFANAMGGSGEEGRKVIIDRLTIRGGEIAISHPSLGDRRLSTDLPEINLTGIGEKSGGATTAEVASQVLNAVLGSASKAAVEQIASGGILPGIGGEEGGGLGKLKDILPGGR